jgi:hypothetical protein
MRRWPVMLEAAFEIVKQAFGRTVRMAGPLIGTVNKTSSGKLSKSEIDIRSILVMEPTVADVRLNDKFQ